MKFANPFKLKGIWLKGNTHTHTTNSDGALSPLEIGCEYAKHGYDFVYLTDHWKMTVPPVKRFGRMLLIPAEEIDFALNGEGFHVVCLGINHEWNRRKFRSMRALVRIANKQRLVLILAHPYWCGNTSRVLLDHGVLAGVEVYNTVCDNMIAKGYSAVHWDDLLDAGKFTLGFAVDDFHSLHGGIGGGWIMAKCKARTPQAILNAIRKGYFYSTQGPLISDVQISGRNVSVTCTSVERISFMSNKFYGRTNRRQPKGKALTRAAWKVPKECSYVRIECIDRNGRTAWTNPIVCSS